MHFIFSTRFVLEKNGKTHFAYSKQNDIQILYAVTTDNIYIYIYIIYIQWCV